MSTYLETGLRGKAAIVEGNLGNSKILAIYARQIRFDLHLLLDCYEAVTQCRSNEQQRIAEAEQIAYEVLPQYSLATRRKLAQFCLNPWPLLDLPTD